MSAAVYFACGCSSHQPIVGGDPVEVRLCVRHKKLDVVKAALVGLAQAQDELRKAFCKAHDELPPMQIEQEERQASGDDRWR